MLAFRETKFSRSCRQSYTRLRNGRWLISRSRRLRLSRCWKRRTDYQQNFKAKSRSLTVIRKRRGLVRDDTVTPDRWITFVCIGDISRNTKEKTVMKSVSASSGGRARDALSGRPKVAIVTGGSSGIGLEMVKKLIEKGYRVVANSRK